MKKLSLGTLILHMKKHFSFHIVSLTYRDVYFQGSPLHKDVIPIVQTNDKNLI